MMTEPKQPEDHPVAPEPAPPAPDAGQNAPNGVPTGADADAKGWPTDDRQATETAAHPDKHADNAEGGQRPPK